MSRMMIQFPYQADPGAEYPGHKTHIAICASSAEASAAAAGEIAELIRAKSQRGERAVLGLATGSTPQEVYSELVRLHKHEGVSFRNVVTFNLDEYWPMQPESLQSYHRFMREHLFDHVDIEPRNVHIPDGTLAAETIDGYCRAYEQRIRDAGGIDLQLLGIGRTGHIGFNEPGSRRTSRTRLVTLDKITRLDAASDFFGERNVPRRAISMGVGTILDARSIVLLAFGEGKAGIIRQAVEGDVTSAVAASFLRRHAEAKFMLDAAAAGELTPVKTPWLLGAISQFGQAWDEQTTRRAVIWLALKLGKPILKLVAEEYNENGLQELLSTRGSAYDVNIEVFRSLQNTITGWPGGKPDGPQPRPAPSAGAERPTPGPSLAGTEVALTGPALAQTGVALTGPAFAAKEVAGPTTPAEGDSEHQDAIGGLRVAAAGFGRAVFPKRVVVFSPHPDDDVISMGGTLIRLCEQGHDVHVAYQTSGNIAVWDEEAVRHADFVADFCREFDLFSAKDAQRIEQVVQAFVGKKSPGQIDSAELARIKALIRRSEARAAARYSGVRPENIHFLDLPFYETGRVRKKPLSDEDVRIVVSLLRQVRPHQIYAAGDLSDPHGTHRVCLAAVERALEQIRGPAGAGSQSTDCGPSESRSNSGASGFAWIDHCDVFYYRGAWQEWEPHQIDMAVPLSPDEVERKRMAIFKHGSQKDRALFPGPSDVREFWQRAEQRNAHTARLYDKLGLPEYEAIEAFVRQA